VATAGIEPSEFWLGLLLDGFYLAPRGMGALATPASDTDVEALAMAIVRRTRVAQALPA